MMTIEQTISRLRQLANGAAPLERMQGLCYEVVYFDPETGRHIPGRVSHQHVEWRKEQYERLCACFVALQLDADFPVGGPSPTEEDQRYTNLSPTRTPGAWEFAHDDLWDGLRGECRRELAHCVANVLERGSTSSASLERLHSALRELAKADGRPDPVCKGD